MRIRFFGSNIVFFLLLKKKLCSFQTKELEITPKTLESVDCAQGAQITSIHSTISSLETQKQEISQIPENQSSIRTENSPNNVMVLEGTDRLSINQNVGVQPKEALSPNDETIDELKKTAEQFDKAMVLESKDRNYIMMEAVIHLKTTNDEFNNLFTNLKYELTHVPEFYDYFDVLSFIDKSIIHIQGFLETLTGDNLPNFFKTREGITDKIGLELENLKLFCVEVQNLDKKKNESDQNISKFNFVEDGLSSIEARKNFIEKHYLEYRRFSYQDYLKAIFMKHNKLTNLEAYLKKVRKVICSLCEEDIKKHADLFKTKFKTVVKEVYEKLIECNEKEKNILNFLFDILNGILKGIRECGNELEVIKNIIENNGKPSRDE
jgi:hypothetical protein